MATKKVFREGGEGCSCRGDGDYGPPSVKKKVIKGSGGKTIKKKKK